MRNIRSNGLESQTINYDFTSCTSRYYTNPFYKTERESARYIRRLDFEIILTDKVHSLECAFSGMPKLEYVNLKDTSRIESMKEIFSEFNQSINRRDTTSVTDMSEMFCDADSFNQPTNTWKITGLRSKYDSFCNARAFSPLQTLNCSAEILHDSSEIFGLIRRQNNLPFPVHAVSIILIFAAQSANINIF